MTSSSLLKNGKVPNSKLTIVIHVDLAVFHFGRLLTLVLDALYASGLLTDYHIFETWRIQATYMCGGWKIFTDSGLKITAGQPTMSGQNADLSGQNFGLAVILTGQVHGFQINITKKFIRSIS